MFDPFNRSSSANASRTIKGWVSSALRLSEDHTLLVTELKCTEPDCPPIETVVAVLGPGGQQHQAKVHLAINEITREEALKLALDLQRLMAGEKRDNREDCDGHH